VDTGDRLEGRWTLLRRAPTRDAVQRWVASDQRTGTPVEVLVLPASRASASDRDGFARVHEHLRDHGAPGLVETLHVHRGEDRAWAVRATVSDGTLQQARAPLPAGQVAALGVVLAPIVAAAGPAARGVLRAADIALDAAGDPVFAPSGAPLKRVAGGAGGLPDVLEALAARGGAPAPPALRDALVLLRDTDPARRASALPLLAAAATPLLGLEALLRPTDRTGSVKVTTHGPALRSAREDQDPAGLVLIPASRLRALDPAQRSVAAGIAGVPVSALAALISAGRPLVLEALAGPSQARRRAQQLVVTTGLPVVQGARATVPGWVPTAITGAVGVTGFGLAAAIGVLFSWTLAVPIALVSLAAVFAGGVLARTARRTTRHHGAGLQGLEHSRAAAGAVRSDTVLASVWDTLTQLRVQVGAADLPAAIAIDLRSTLAALEERLTDLTRAAPERTDRRKDWVDAEAADVRSVLDDVADVLHDVRDDPEDNALRRLAAAAHRAAEAARRERSR